MRMFKTFALRSGWNFSVSELAGGLAFDVAKDEKSIRLYTRDTISHAEYFFTHTKHREESAVKDPLDLKANLLGSRIGVEEDETSLMLHTCPTNPDTGAPIPSMMAHYRFEIAGDNAIRVSTWLKYREPLRTQSLSWMCLHTVRDQFDTVQAFDPEFQVGVGNITHAINHGSCALVGKDQWLMITDCGSVTYNPTAVLIGTTENDRESSQAQAFFPENAQLCMLMAATGAANQDVTIFDEAHPLSCVIAFGEGAFQAPQVTELQLPACAVPQGERYELTSGRLTQAIVKRESGVSMLGINLDDFSVDENAAIQPLVRMTARNLKTNELLFLSSDHDWEKVTVKAAKKMISVYLERPNGLPIAVSVEGFAKEKDTIHWNTRVINSAEDYTVMSVTYPAVNFSGGDDPVLFTPKHSGALTPHAYNREASFSAAYPSGFMGVSPVFGIYDQKKKEGSGLYAAVHMAAAARADMAARCFRRGQGCFTFEYPAEKMGLAQNSFSVNGELVVKVLDGDWYDMACIYEAYVKEHAEWYKPLGREDSPAWMKDVPMYIMDWMPNDNPDADPVPISIRPPVEPPRDNWYRKPIELAKRLNLPMGYHLYNWHFIPFNNDFPYYFPVKEGLVEGVDEMKKYGIHVMPYINGHIVDTRARDLSTDLFEKTFADGATRTVSGDLDLETYASHEIDGTLCRLAAMCPSTAVWRETLAEIVRKLFRDYHMSAVYLDQIAAHRIMLCCAPHHNHAPGNGLWWVKEYRLLMEQLRKECPEGCGFTTESNAEVYADQMDGFLTWAWVDPDLVPFFPKVYAGHCAMFGRNTNGYKKGDAQYFRFHVAQSVMFGQQIGWMNADVVDNEEKIDFLDMMCHVRWDYKDLFSAGYMMRPPVAVSEIKTFVSDCSMGHTYMAEANMVQTSAWKDGQEEKAVAFFTNSGLEEETITFAWNLDEYNADDAINAKPWGDAAVVSFDRKTITVRLAGGTCLAVEMQIK